MSSFEATEWESDTAVRCSILHGSLKSRRVTFTAGAEHQITSSEVWSHDSNSLSTDFPMNRAGTGSISVRVQGGGIGALTCTSTLRLEYTSCEETNWVSASSINCLNTAGVSGSRRIVLTTMSQQGSVSHSFSLDAPTMTSFLMYLGTEFRSLEFPGGSTTDRAQRGLMLFFPSKQITVEFWIRNDVAVDDVMQAVMSCKSYTGITTVSTHELVIWAADDKLILEVKNQIAFQAFCPLARGEWAHYAFTWDNSLGRVECIKDGIPQKSQVDIAKGLLFDSQIAMVIGQDWANTKTTENSFKGGISQLRIWNIVISRRMISYGRTKTYPQSMIDRGDFINMIAYYEFLQYFTGNDRSGKNNHLSIVGRAESEAVPVGPSLVLGYSEKSLLVPPNQPTTGTKSVLLRGSAFGVQDITVEGRSRHVSACEATDWLSDSGVTIRVSAALSASRTTVITAGQLSNSISLALSVDQSCVSSSYRANTISPGQLVTILGSGFGLRDHSDILALQYTDCETTIWLSDSSILAFVATSLSGTRIVSITAGIQASSHTESFSFDACQTMPNLMERLNHPSTGCTSLTLAGSGFANFMGCIRVRLGHSQAEVSSWISSTAITAQSMYGIETTRRTSVTAGISTASHTAAMSFDQIQIKVHPTQRLVNQTVPIRNHATTGSTLLTLLGSGFGHQEASPDSSSLGTCSETSEWTSGKSWVFREKRGMLHVGHVLLNSDGACFV